MEYFAAIDSQNDNTPALVWHEVVKLVVRQSLVLHKSPGELLLVPRKDEMVKGSLIPDNLIEIIYIELRPVLGLEVETFEPGRRQEALLVGERLDVLSPLQRPARRLDCRQFRETISGVLGAGRRSHVGMIIIFTFIITPRCIRDDLRCFGTLQGPENGLHDVVARVVCKSVNYDPASDGPFLWALSLKKDLCARAGSEVVASQVFELAASCREAILDLRGGRAERQWVSTYGQALFSEVAVLADWNLHW